MNYLALMQLFSQLDPETAGLFTQFVAEAGKAPSVNEYVKEKLRIALRPEPKGPKHIEVEVLEQDGRPVGSSKTRVRR